MGSRVNVCKSKIQLKFCKVPTEIGWEKEAGFWIPVICPVLLQKNQILQV